MAHLSASPSMLYQCFRPQASTSNDVNDFLPRRNPNNDNFPHFSMSKTSWVIRTESNVRKFRRKKPEPSCAVCEGSGRIDCHHCQGKGRSNYAHLTMLPKGEWPKWCRTCGGSGLEFCSRCLGTGEYRDIMGFHFMKVDTNQDGDIKKSRGLRTDGKLSSVEMLFSQPSESEHELG